ncbi:MAG TPA: hypothetical protein VMX58_09710 [Patescibacteria group bacterium]|nr:hypothetical protein [Patescibacteria group bacterium]
MKRSIVLCVVISLWISQGIHAKENPPAKISSYEAFISERGKVITKDTFQLMPLESLFKTLNICVIKMADVGKTEYFVQLSVSANNVEMSTYISYRDIMDLKKALEKIDEGEYEDYDGGAETHEIFFITNDGCKFGSYTTVQKNSVYIDLSENYSEDIFYFEDMTAILGTLDEAIGMIEGLKGE